MSEPRKNQLNIDGGQVTGEDNIASYKPILDPDSELKPSKSKEKVSDEAEEKLLKKDLEAKATIIDMADAKYIVGEQRNGDAKIELDANKKFAGLTKEELMKYADDPFWVRVRWTMFILFWALWLCMLAGAIAIIVRAPKCQPPPPLEWYEKGPLVDLSDLKTLQDVEDQLTILSSSHVQGVFVSSSIVKETYEVLDEEPSIVFQQFQKFANRARDLGVRVIVDLTANFVPDTHKWFILSQNRTENYTNYFIWAKGKADGMPPNNWLSVNNASAWKLSESRGEFLLQQYGQPDLNLTNPEVVAHFDLVLQRWMQAGAAGIRLLKARQMLVSPTLADEPLSRRGADPEDYHSLQHNLTTDQPELDPLLQHWSHLANIHNLHNDTEKSVFTLHESGDMPELWLLARDSYSLRPASAAPLRLDANATAAYIQLNKRLEHRPAIQMVSSLSHEAAALAMFLPATPVLSLSQIQRPDDISLPAEWVSRLAALRSDASVERGNHTLRVYTDGDDSVLVVIRWEPGHTGYAALYNGGTRAARADLHSLPAVPDVLTVLHAAGNNTFTHNQQVSSTNLMVPPRSTLVLSYVPNPDQ